MKTLKLYIKKKNTIKKTKIAESLYNEKKLKKNNILIKLKKIGYGVQAL